MNNVAILLGAGSSIPAGFPSTQELTKSILRGHGIHRGTDEIYRFNHDLAESQKGIHPRLDNLVKLSDLMARWFHKEANRYYSTRHWLINNPVNYEDIFYLAEQVLSDEWERENPAIRLFIEDAKEYIRLFSEIARYVDVQEENEEYTKVFSEVCNYIADITWGRLCVSAKEESHLRIIQHVCNDFQVACISTLCHDIHVETFLRNKGVSFADGFCVNPEANVRYWNGEFSSNEENAGKIPFLKIHGSIDWFRFRPIDGDAFDAKIGIPLDGDQEHTRTLTGDFQIALNGGRPLLLIGTFNKISDYSRGVFLDLFYALRSALVKADIMIICGYSFGDKGVNGEIVNWYYGKRGRRFVIIHPDPEMLISNARPAIKQLFHRHPFFRGDAISSTEYIQKHLEDVDPDELDAAIAI